MASLLYSMSQLVDIDSHSYVTMAIPQLEAFMSPMQSDIHIHIMCVGVCVYSHWSSHVCLCMVISVKL